jgi:UDP-GlcNAc:undecaprenyl-phosphate GlcNAc-1-phosphate transferase
MASTIGFLIGLADDAYNTNPILKFLAQLFCGLTLIFTGTFIHFFSSDVANYLLTLFWVIGIMNSINLLDNMDGIATVVSISIVGTALLVLAMDLNFSSSNFIVLVGVLASLIGFLSYNRFPSRMYMGDTGSQFLGVFLASISIVYFWNLGLIYPSRFSFLAWKQIAIPVLVFILPIFDTSFVFLNRMRKGKSPFIGGKDHTTHRLAYLGFSEKKVAQLFFIISAGSSALAFFLYKFADRSKSLLYLVCSCYFFAAVAGFIYISYLTLKHKRKEKIEDQYNENRNN